MSQARKIQLNISPEQARRLERLAELHGMCLAQMMAYAINQWVFDNYKDHLDKFKADRL